jgi:hypothetical protein
MDPMTLMALAQMGQGFGAALGTGGSEAWGNALSPSVLGGYLKGRGQKKAKKKAQKRFNRALNQTEAIQGMGLQQQEAFARQATSQTLGGFDTARKEASRLGRGAKRSALDRETQLGARASQSLANRGLGSTTMGANLQRGIASDTNREMSSIDEGLAGMFGDLALGRAGAEASGTQRLADLAGQRTNLQSQLGQMRLLGGATLGSLGNFDPGSWQPGYMQDNSEAFGSLMGSFGGGGMGGMPGMGGMGGGGMQGGMNPQMLQYLFGGGM